MRSFTFYAPTKILFGKETEKKVGREIKEFGGQRVLLHYGSKSAKKSGLLDRVEASLKEAGVFYLSLGGVEPNPKLSLVREGIALCQKESLDFVLAVGGGSVIDSAKAIAVGVGSPELDIWDDIIVKKVPLKDALPVASILTIAAAGSEMSYNMVLTNEDGMIKRGYASQKIRPKFSILNPELTYTLPSYQTACGCADIMMHTMERYFTLTSGNEMTDHIALGVLKTTVKFAPKALEAPDDYDARSEIMWAGSLSHNTLTGLGANEDWATHQLGHELSGMFDAAHGATLTAMWGSWARFVYKNRPERFAAFGAELFGLELTGDAEADALRAIGKTEEFFSSIGLPTNSRELVGALSEKQLEELSYKCTFGRTRTIGTFMELGYDDILKIYRDSNSK